MSQDGNLIMADITIDIEQRVKRDQLNTLYSETRTSLLSTLAIMAAFVFVLSTHEGMQSLFLWYGALVVVLMARALVYVRFTKTELTLDNITLWHRLFYLGILATGLVLGSSSFLFFSDIPVSYQIFSVFVLAGISAGALTVFITDYLVFFIYINAVMLPVAVISAGYSDRLHIAISIMTLIYIFLLMRASRNLFYKVMSSITLGYENQMLVQSLSREKNRLDNRLGRILNDSSSEIYVADADTLQCLQVNLGALEHLGYSEHEIRELSILDILTELERPQFDALLKPLYADTLKFVFYNGHHRRKDGSCYPVKIRLQLSLKESPPIVVATALDMTEQVETRRQLVHQANYDQLTDLPNRVFMLTHVKHAFSLAGRNHKKVALLLMDLDNFKKVNDALGHTAGDILLKEATGRIRALLREADTPARLGGDEFLIMLEGLSRPEQAELIAGKLVAAFKEPFWIQSDEVYASASIGITVFPDDGESVEELMQYADTALYRAKQKGRCRYQFFSDWMRVAMEERLEMEAHLRRALEKNELTLVYQPKVDAVTGRILGAEALLRWTNPTLGFVPPDRFIPLAENLGLIGAIGRWVLDEACREAAKWPTLPDRKVHVAVNVSPHQFRSGRLLDDVEHALENSWLTVERLELEITESLLIQDTDEPLEILNQLRNIGIRLSLDDFGTGYSSLSYLQRFPLQVLKIDRSFVKDMTVNKNSEALVEAIISMAGSLELDIVAEGVEEQEQIDFLGQRGVRTIQGYFFSPPVPADVFRKMLKRQGDGEPVDCVFAPDSR